jgi:hypothetical protein
MMDKNISLTEMKKTIKGDPNPDLGILSVLAIFNFKISRPFYYSLDFLPNGQTFMQTPQMNAPTPDLALKSHNLP